LFDIVFLGTSASAPSVHRGLTSQVVSYRNRRFMIDCGEGTQRQILKSGTGFRRLDSILITHGHLDHILGLAGLLSTFSRWEAIEGLDIYAGEWAMERIHDLIFGVVLRGARPLIDIQLHIIKPGILVEDESFKLTAFPVTHRGPDCFGFAFEEKARRPFLPEKADSLGIPVGPVRRDLVEGQQVTLPDGRMIDPDQVLGPPRPGTRLVHVGDCGATDNLRQVCVDADALVIEATYIDEDQDLAKKFGHLTAKQAGELAQDCNVKDLYLTHISRRYREHQIREDACSVFPNTTVVRDFDQVTIRRSES